MLKRVATIFIPALLLMVFLAFTSQTLAATSPTKTTTKTTAVTPAPAVVQPAGDPQIETVKTIIGKNTPVFIAKPVIWLVESLEYFRQNYFNNVFIFYGFFFVFLFYIVRSIWRFFF